MKLEIQCKNSTSDEAHAIINSIEALLRDQVLKPSKSIELYIGGEDEAFSDETEPRKYNITICVRIEDVMS